MKGIRVIAAGGRRRDCGLVALAAAVVVLGPCSGAAGPAPVPPAPAPPPPLSFAATVAVADRSHFPDRAIQPLVLPAAAGGSGALTYSLSPRVPGLTFTAGSRTLRGTPTQIGEYAMTYAVRDETGASARLTFTISVEKTVRYLGADQVFHVNPGGEAINDEEVNLRLEAPAYVYLIASSGARSGGSTPKVVEVVAGDGPLTFSLPAQPRPPSQPAPEQRWVTEHNNTVLPSLLRSGSRSLSVQPAGPRRAVVKGNSETLRVVLRDGSFNNVPATARTVVTDGSTTVAVWVADREWGCAARQCVTRSMADTVANGFFRAGPANDVYDWVTAIYGVPWGPHESAGYIPASAAGEIHILLYDVAGDGLPTPGDSRRVIGRFHSVHNCLRASAVPLCQGSMLFLDSPVLTLDVDRAVSTLAHELQHMIHYYQKPVLRGASSETWLNEVASLVAEDLVADKIRVDGPRGVAYGDPTAGQPDNRSGRLPRYNLYNDLQVTAWQGTLANYSISYALGAYLARNYGGAELFSRIVRSERAGVDAVEGALRGLGHEVSFPQVLANWAVAGLLSDNTGAPVPYRYNAGTWSTSRAGGTEYRLGSINLYHYRRHGGAESGPYLRDLSAFNAYAQPPHSNKYALLGRLTGSPALRLTAPAGLRLTMVFKGARSAGSGAGPRAGAPPGSADLIAVTGRVTVTGSEPNVQLVIVADALTYELVGAPVAELWGLQQRRVTVRGRVVREAYGPGFPAQLQVESYALERAAGA